MTINETLRAYIDGIEGRNELSVGPLMCATAMSEADAALRHLQDLLHAAQEEVRGLREASRDPSPSDDGGDQCSPDGSLATDSQDPT